MELPDGRHLLARLALPMPLDTAGRLMRAIGEEAERIGYTDVVWMTGAEHNGWIAGTPPKRT